MEPSPNEPRVAKSLTDLATDVHLAREAVRAHRFAPVVWEDLNEAQSCYLRAMEVFVRELTARHLPVPHRLRDDLRLQRHLYGGPCGRSGTPPPTGRPANRTP